VLLIVAQICTETHGANDGDDAAGLSAAAPVAGKRIGVLPNRVVQRHDRGGGRLCRVEALTSCRKKGSQAAY